VCRQEHRLLSGKPFSLAGEQAGGWAGQPNRTRPDLTQTAD